MGKPKILPPTYFLVAIVAMIVSGLFLPLASIIPPFWNLVGVIPFAAGVYLSIAADGMFHKANTTVIPGEESSQLVTGGLYRLTRNPMYLGFVLILLGVAVLLRSLTPYLFVIAFVILIDRAFIRMEEGMLARKFGAAWNAYRRTTRRWI